MSCFANGSAVKLYYVQEVDGAIPASPEFKPIRFVSEGVSPAINQIESNEINPQRQRAASRGGTYSVQGEVAAELSFGSYDDLIEAALQGTWTADVLKVGSTERTFAILERHTDVKAAIFAGTTVSAAATDNSFNDSGSGFIAAGFKVGDKITVAGFTTSANNGTFTVTAVTAGKLTIGGTDGDAIADEVAGDAVTISVPLDYIYRGCRVNTLNISAPLGDKAQVTFGLIGTKAEGFAIPAGATFAAASTSDIMVTTNGSFTEDGALVAHATNWNVTLNNGMEASFSLFQREAYCITNGIAAVSGTMSAYLVDRKLWDKVLNETKTSHVIVLEEGGDSYTITLPNVRYTAGTKQVGGPGAVIPEYTLSAGYDDAEATTIKIER